VIDMRPPVTVAPGDESRAETALAHVSSALWRIRELLDLLTFKLETEQVLVAAGRTRWLGRATHEVELVLEEIRHAELRRSIELGDVADVLGLDPDCSLRDLAAAAPPPWDDVLEDHRESLLTATSEISSLAESNRELLDTSYRALQEALGLASPTPEASTYTADGATTPQTTRRLFDQST
jgi:FlgN protein